MPVKRLPDRRVLVAAAVAALLLFQLPLALRDLWREAGGAPWARRIEALRAPESERIANAFAVTVEGDRPEFTEFGQALPPALASIPLEETLHLVTPHDFVHGLVGDRFAGLLYPRAVRFHPWPLGQPAPPPLASGRELWFLRVGEAFDPSASPTAEVLATGELFTLWRSAGAPR